MTRKLCPIAITTGAFRKHYYVDINVGDRRSGVPKFLSIEVKNRKEQKKLFNFLNELEDLE